MAASDDLKQQIEQAFDLVSSTPSREVKNSWLERGLLIMAVAALSLGLAMLASVFFL